VAARPGETVLDLCAGAGGKTLQRAGAVAPGGVVHAADPDGERLGRLRHRAARAGATPLVTVDGGAPPPGLRADRVLVDAPCSELGALRRGPDLRFRLDPAALDGYPALQERLLATAACHIRDGGRLVYATCTFRTEENEEVARRFERSHPRFERAATVRTWPHREGCDGFFVTIWDEKP
jgi:16S rRNA (cytosine967-C5)-methyltransferase